MQHTEKFEDWLKQTMHCLQLLGHIALVAPELLTGYYMDNVKPSRAAELFNIETNKAKRL